MIVRNMGMIIFNSDYNTRIYSEEHHWKLYWQLASCLVSENVWYHLLGEPSNDKFLVCRGGFWVRQNKLEGARDFSSLEEALQYFTVVYKTLGCWDWICFSHTIIRKFGKDKQKTIINYIEEKDALEREDKNKTI